MVKMHEHELRIEEHLVRDLLEKQCPQWAGLPLQAVKSSGTDNALFRLGQDYLVRLPRIDWAVASINREYEWLPRIARCLKVLVSEPLMLGKPDASYPWPWLIVKWNEGQNPGFETANEYDLLARDLALFLNNLHGIELNGGPNSRRGIPLREMDADTRKAISGLDGEIDVQSVSDLWCRLSAVPYWNRKAVWVHGDFLPGNVLIKEGRLCAVIDFSDMGMGDPACDLVIAWSLLNAQSRAVFRNSLEYIDDAAWERGRGWALSIALIMLPYYKHSNPVLAALARKMIEKVLAG